MTGFNTLSDPRNQLAQLLQQPQPVTMPPPRSTYTPTTTQYAGGSTGGSTASPLLGGALQYLGKGSPGKTATSNTQTLWPQLNDASFMNGTSPGQIMWSNGAPGTAENAFNGGAWLGGGGISGADILGPGTDAAAFDGGAWLGGGGAEAGLGGADLAGAGALVGGGEAIGGGAAAAGGVDSLAAVIAANPELLALLA